MGSDITLSTQLGTELVNSAGGALNWTAEQHTAVNHVAGQLAGSAVVADGDMLRCLDVIHGEMVGVTNRPLFQNVLATMLQHCTHSANQAQIIGHILDLGDNTVVEALIANAHLLDGALADLLESSVNTDPLTRTTSLVDAFRARQGIAPASSLTTLESETRASAQDALAADGGTNLLVALEQQDAELLAEIIAAADSPAAQAELALRLTANSDLAADLLGDLVLDGNPAVRDFAFSTLTQITAAELAADDASDAGIDTAALEAMLLNSSLSSASVASAYHSAAYQSHICGMLAR